MSRINRVRHQIAPVARTALAFVLACALVVVPGPQSIRALAEPAEDPTLSEEPVPSIADNDEAPATTSDEGDESDGEPGGEVDGSDPMAAPEIAEPSEIASDDTSYDTTTLSDSPDGGPGEWVIDNIYSIAFGLVSTIALEGFSYGADAHKNEDLEKIIKFADGLLGGNPSIDAECKQILAAVNELSSQVTELENNIGAQIAALQQNETRDMIETQRSKIVKMADSVYARAIDAYNAYIKAAQLYNQYQGSTDKKKYLRDLRVCENAMVDQFDSLEYGDDIETIETNGLAMGKHYDRYLYHLNRYADESCAFDHQRYAILTAGINDIVSNLSIIGYVQRLEYDYWSTKAANDDSLQKKAVMLEHALRTNLNYIARDINFALSEYANVRNDQTWSRPDLLTLMRPYDFETTYDFNYSKSSNQTLKIQIWNAYQDWYYYAQAVKTKPTMPVYRAVVGGQPFLVVNGDQGLSFGKKDGGHIHGIHNWEREKYQKIFSYDYFGAVDQDLLNLMQTEDGVYYLPKDFSPLSPLVTTKSYAASGGSLTHHLKANGMSSIGSEQYVIMDNYDDYARHTGVRQQNHYTRFYFYNTNIPSSGDYSKQKETLSSEDTTPDYPLLAVLAQKDGAHESYRLNIETSGSGLDITATDAEGKPLPEDIPAGTLVKLSVKTTEPSALNSLVLYDAQDGTVLETLANEQTANLAYDSTEDTVAFTFPMPYRDAQLVGKPGEAPKNPLHFTENGEDSYLISSIDDLRKMAAAYEHHAEMYKHATFTLANDIVNLRMPFLSWDTPIGSEEHPFTGTFDGAGHAIGGFSTVIDKDDPSARVVAGLFGVVGQGGTVANLSVYAMSHTCTAQLAQIDAGGIAGRNYGMISNCSSGSAQTSFAPTSNMLTPEEFVLMNVTVDTGSSLGVAGGIVGYNQGDVLNCWSGADVAGLTSASFVGGLVGYAESGTIWNSYALGNVQGDFVGGFAGSINHQAQVYNCYFAGQLVEGAEPRGSFVSQGHGAIDACYTVDDVDAPPIGSSSTSQTPDIEAYGRDDMKAQSFADELNGEVGSGMLWWTWSQEGNAGFPSLIDNGLSERMLVDGDTGISALGTFHLAAQFDAEPIDAGNEAAQAFHRYAQEEGLLGSITAMYLADLAVGSRRTDLPAFDGLVTLCIPLADEFANQSVTVLQRSGDGFAAHQASVRDGAAYVEVDAVTPFAVIVAGDPLSQGGTTLAPTGDNLPARGLLALALVGGMAAVLLAVSICRRKNHR